MLFRSNPEHISCYSLIIEEGTPFYTMYEKGLLDLPKENDEREMYKLTIKSADFSNVKSTTDKGVVLTVNKIPFANPSPKMMIDMIDAYSTLFLKRHPIPNKKNKIPTLNKNITGLSTK